VAFDQKYRRLTVTVPVAVNTSRGRSPLLRAGGRSLIAGSGGGKSDRLGRWLSLYFRLDGQLQSLTGHGQSRLAEGHFAGIDPVSIGRVLQRLESLGKLFSKTIFHLMHQHVVIHGLTS